MKLRLLILCIPFILGCNETTKLHYGDRIIVSDGFYKNMKGTVVGEKRSVVYVNDIWYEVDLDKLSKNELILSKNLTSINCEKE